MARDFSDAGTFENKSVLMAEMIAHFNPKIVELHNYIPTSSLSQKVNNWKVLNGKTIQMQTKCLKN